ncbi:hypothetical protein [Ferruginibacter sp.]|nr:hypothetical protein [Ferruginibacter sp.]
MKKLVMFTAAAIFSATLFVAQATPVIKYNTANNALVKATPPQAVLTAFAAMFGNAPVRQWKLRSDGNWRAHFLRNGIAWEATFTSGGVLVKSERA